jgi:hypothetical protein
MTHLLRKESSLHDKRDLGQKSFSKNLEVALERVVRKNAKRINNRTNLVTSMTGATSEEADALAFS